MMPSLTVIVCTHNPHAGRLARTLDGLLGQTLDRDLWELLLIDNRSETPLVDGLVSWHPNGRVIREETLGLTPARLRGITEAVSDHLVWVDDDNVLTPDFLTLAMRVFSERPEIGVFGGPARPEYDSEPPEWFDQIRGPLGVGDHGDEERLVCWDSRDDRREYPEFSPRGAGMCLRKEVAVHWAALVREDKTRLLLGRRGNNLSSGEDNDIVLTVLGLGCSVGYYPGLALTHLIPAGRLTPEYHARVLRSSNRTWVVVLEVHGVSPWKPIPPWTLPLRKLKAYLRCRPWQGVVRSLRWHAVAGRLEGQAVIWGLRTTPTAQGGANV